MTDTIYLPENATDKDILKAVTSLTLGGTVVLPPNADIKVTAPILTRIDGQHITIDLNNSTLTTTGNFSAIDVYGSEKELQSVKIGLNATGDTTLTYDKLPDDIGVGKWLKVTADNSLPGDHIDPGDKGQTTNLGQAAQIVAVDGNTVVVRGELVEQDLYTRNVRAGLYADGSFTLVNGHLQGNQEEFNENGPALVRVRSLTGTSIRDLTVADASNGIAFVNNVSANATDVSGTNLHSVVQSATSSNTSINGLFAEHVSHGVLVHTTGTALNSSSASNYGADIGLVAKNSVVYDAIKAAYDFHSESRNGVYTDSLAFDSRMFGDLRGIGNKFVDSAGIGNSYGVQFYEYGDGDGRNALVDNLTLREITNYSFILSGDPRNNIVMNSHFESYGKGYGIAPEKVSLVNTVVEQNVVGDTDTLIGSSASDKLLGGKGADLIYGQEGADYLWGGTSTDFLDGGAGRDRFAYNALDEGGDFIAGFVTGNNGDVIDVSVLGLRLGWDQGDYLAEGLIRVSQAGPNSLVEALHQGAWTVLAVMDKVLAASFTSANLQVKLSEPLPQLELPAVDRFGTPAGDWLKGSSGADIFHGSAGDDSYTFNNMMDRLAEGPDEGNDTIWTTVGVDMRGYNQIENIRLEEAGGPATVFGNDANNLITGNGEANVIVPGLGVDRLYGKGGADIFVFAEVGPANADSIWDFSDDDRIALESNLFTGLDGDGDGAIDHDAFSLGNAATATHAQIIYDNQSGKLYYDSDGVGGSQMQLVVNLPTAKSFFDFESIVLL